MDKDDVRSEAPATPAISRMTTPIEPKAPQYPGFTREDAREIGKGIKEASFFNPHKGETEDDEDAIRYH